MAETYKLNYFNIYGLAEPIRLIFAYAQVKFEDNRIEKEDWPKLKESFPWGQLPTLELGSGQVISQSLAIGRFLARKFNLTGVDDLEAAKCDELIDALKDVHNEFRPALRETDEEKKHEMKVRLATEVTPKFFAKIEAILNANGGKHLVGKTRTWADLYYLHTLHFYDEFLDADEILNDFPTLHAFLEEIFTIPQIKTYIAHRPFSLM